MTGNPAVPPQHRRIIEKQPSSRRVASDRYQHDVGQIITRSGSSRNPSTSFTRDHHITRNEYQLNKNFRETACDDELAQLFGVATGEPVLERRFVFYAQGVPQQLSTSYLLLALVCCTPVADPANEPWPGGTIAQLGTLKVFVSRVEESVAARMPLPEEGATLCIPVDVPVLTITRRMLAGPDRNHVVEVANIVIPANRTVLEYSIDLQVWPEPVRTFYQSHGDDR
jgi:GntR family transcriptional regulator